MNKNHYTVKNNVNRLSKYHHLDATVKVVKIWSPPRFEFYEETKDRFIIINIIVFVWSRNGASRTKAFVKGHSWHQNDDFVGGATC